MTDARDVPTGTVSGAPKIRAMQIISELESGWASVRASRLGSSLAPPPYAGCVGYFSFNGNLDTCVWIRSTFSARILIGSRKTVTGLISAMVSGTPKIYAMQITSALEGTTRGPYAGCVGYFSFAVGRASARAGSLAG